MMFVIVWRFEARPGCEAEFEYAYGPDGPWTELFRREPAYVGTELLRDIENGGFFVTIDRWESREAYQSFLAEHAEAYHRVDAECERLTIMEERIGIFM